MKVALIEENLDAMAEDILADYDIPLFERYHIFLLDPREKDRIAEDATAGLDYNMNSAGYFSGWNSDISVQSKKSALSDQGNPVRKQIKEWELSQGLYKLPKIMNQLLKGTDQKEEVKKKLTSSEMATEKEKKEDDGEKEETEEEKRVKRNWSEWKKVLENILNSGILLYAVDSSHGISNLNLAASKDLPSKSLGLASKLFDSKSISLTTFSDLKKIYEKESDSDSETTSLTSEMYMVPYIFDNFTNYMKNDTARDHCLKYEMEYLIAGKTKDKENLKSVADEIFLMRFLVNYAYAANEAEISGEAHAMAAILTGILGFPAVEPQVAMLLIASLCYGESLLEVRALFRGEKVAIIKSPANWNVSFSNIVTKVKGKADIKKVSNGLNYQNYLLSLILLRSNGKKLLYRMMDLMQCNVALEETGFLMKNCLMSFQWTGKFTWNPLISVIPTMGLTWNHPFSIERKKIVTYR